MSSIAKRLIPSTVLVLLGAGCAPVIPRELSEARLGYERASWGAAAQLAPAELREAKAALDQAEHSFEKQPRAPETRDLAYVAMRKVQRAESLANRATLQRTKAQADQEHARKQARMLAAAREQLARTEESRAGSEAQLARSRQQLAASLAKLAEVREDARGLVITLSGNVLFETGSAVLEDDARLKLDQIATTLLGADKECRLDIEGHTDSLGSGTLNAELSQRRAEAVRDYLVTRGCRRERIGAEGMGEEHPIASNASPSGRAQNRRVELILRSAWSTASR